MKYQIAIQVRQALSGQFNSDKATAEKTNTKDQDIGEQRKRKGVYGKTKLPPPPPPKKKGGIELKPCVEERERKCASLLI